MEIWTGEALSEALGGEDALCAAGLDMYTTWPCSEGTGRHLPHMHAQSCFAPAAHTSSAACPLAGSLWVLLLTGWQCRASGQASVASASISYGLQHDVVTLSNTTCCCLLSARLADCPLTSPLSPDSQNQQAHSCSSAVLAASRHAAYSRVNPHTVQHSNTAASALPLSDC